MLSAMGLCSNKSTLCCLFPENPPLESIEKCMRFDTPYVTFCQHGLPRLRDLISSMSNIRTTHVIYHLHLYVLRFPLESKAAGCTVKIDVIETSRSRGPTPEAGTLEISRELGPCFLMQQPKRVATF